MPPPLDRADRRFDQAARCAAAGAVVALLLLCGCDGKPPERAEAGVPPALADRYFPPSGWAWGRLEVPGAPPLRYGVAAPAGAAKAQVLILPGAGEPAEAWFETASDLAARGYVVWAMDWVGQGGSTRWRGAEDRLYALSLDPDVVALRVMIETVIRPGRNRPPLLLVADGMGAQLALRGLARPDIAPGVAGAVLGAPALAPRDAGLSSPFGRWGGDAASAIGLGRPFVAGEHGWRQPVRTSRDRNGVADLWMQANPSLRIGGASLAWATAFNRSAAAARNPATLARIAAPVLMLGGPDARRACTVIKACRFVLSPDGPPHLANDPARRLWLTEATGFVDQHTKGYAAGAAPVR